MEHDRLEPAFEIKQEKVAHEIEARRERREIAIERGVERVLLHECKALRVVAQRLYHALRQFGGSPRGPVDRHQARVEIGCLDRQPKRPARALKLSRLRVALEVHKKDHVVSGGKRHSAEIEAFEPLQTRPDDQHVRIDADDSRKMRGQDFVEKQAAEHRAREAALADEAGAEALEVEGHELDALAQRARQPVEAGQDVVGLAEEENLALLVRLGLDQGSDRAHCGREERPVRREAIGGSHCVPRSPHFLRPLARSRGPRARGSLTGSTARANSEHNSSGVRGLRANGFDPERPRQAREPGVMRNSRHYT